MASMGGEKSSYSQHIQHKNVVTVQGGKAYSMPEASSSSLRVTIVFLGCYASAKIYLKTGACFLSA